MPFDFQKNAAKGNEFVRLVGEELEVPLDIAGSIIRAVFHALRNRLSHEESFQLMAQLPVALKGAYVDGWKFNKDSNRISLVNDFIDELRKEDRGLSGYDFSNDSKAKIAVTTVFKALNYFVSEEEMKDMVDILPADLQKFIKESISGQGTVL